MSYSNSSLNTFLECQRKYWHTYVNYTQSEKPPSPHLVFGTMAHKVLYDAGVIRDEIADGVRDVDDYESIIPSEILYPELKEYFNIRKWGTYFIPIINQIAEYENQIIDEIGKTNEVVYVHREKKLALTKDELRSKGFTITEMKEPLVGVIDLLIRTKSQAYILDYKFSTKRKSQVDFDMNSQLYIYALLVNAHYNIPLQNIQVGYIDIPKQEFAVPVVLSDGKLSRAKTQNVSAELYKAAVQAIHGNDPYYNCEEGGYYYNAYLEFSLNKSAYLATQYLDLKAYPEIIADCFATIDTIEHTTNYLRKYDSYSCRDCEYLHTCKEWI